jgi:hypothetical protein
MSQDDHFARRSGTLLQAHGGASEAAIGKTWTVHKRISGQISSAMS